MTEMERQDRLSPKKRASLSHQKALKINFLVIGIASILVLVPIIATAIKIRAVSSLPMSTIYPTPTRIPTATATSQPDPTPTPRSMPTPRPTPTPAPLTPFPATFAQQLAVMQAKGRYFLHGNTQLPEIALTFDDGPNPTYTPQVLAILRQYKVKATFFCVGSMVQAYPSLVKQEYAEGHVIGNHTWGHPNMPSLSIASIIWQLTTAGDAIQQVIGVRPDLFRPPYGAISNNVLTYANYLGLTIIQWNVDPRDWSRPGVDVIYARVLAQTSAGSIILMHDGGGDRTQTVAALPMIIEWFQTHGFQFVTIPRLVHDAHLIPGIHTTTSA
jgi:peptidoglycan/xylan/chitin deacetylase (PgdA/CDA1 family)